MRLGSGVAYPLSNPPDKTACTEASPFPAPHRGVVRGSTGHIFLRGYLVMLHRRHAAPSPYLRRCLRWSRTCRKATRYHHSIASSLRNRFTIRSIQRCSRRKRLMASWAFSIPSSYFLIAFITTRSNRSGLVMAHTVFHRGVPLMVWRVGQRRFMFVPPG